MAIQFPSRIPSYYWEKAYKAAVLEPDNARLEKHIAVAERSLLLRLLELTNHPAHKIETIGLFDTRWKFFAVKFEEGHAAC